MNRKKKRLLLSAALTPILLVPLASSCATTVEMNSTGTADVNNGSRLRVATYNISFAVDNDNSTNGGADYYARWEKYLSYNKQEQDALIEKWKQNEPTSKKPSQSKTSIDTDEHLIAERLIQIKNIAAQIQFNRPDIVLLNEFNNNGKGDSGLMKKFQENFLSHPQLYDGVGGSKTTEPINYPYTAEYATNTGLLATDDKGQALDLDNDGFAGKQATQDLHGVDEKGNAITIYKGMVYVEKGTKKETGKPIYVYEPDDTFGFGYFHGHYAFGVMSKYELDRENERTFQTFKLKDMPNGTQYRSKVDNRINSNSNKDKYKDANGANNSTPLKEGDNWHNDTEWNNFRMSSKNHVDLPVKVGKQIIHLLLSHPTPPAFDKVSPQNVLRNRAEVEFWKHYINNEQSIYDDKGNKGGIDGSKEKFIILGDLNADNYGGADDDKKGDKHKPSDYNTGNGIRNLVGDKKINQLTIAHDAEYAPKSNAAKTHQSNNPHPHPELRTAVFGSRPDWAIASSTLEVVGSGLYWDDQWQATYNLFIDPRLGNYGNSKEVSSDHRLVWVDVRK